MTAVRVNFNTGQKIFVEAGSKLSEAIALSGIEMDFPCGGRGKCGQCKVTVRKENDVHKKDVLSCTYPVTEDLWVENPDGMADLQTSILVSGLTADFEMNPGLEKHYVKAVEMTGQPYWNEVKNQAEGLGFFLSPSLPLLQDTANYLQEENRGMTLVASGKQVIHIEPGDTSDTCYGLAVDIGTTTVVGYLTDLLSGEIKAVDSALNGQRAFGADIISRINAVYQNKDNLSQLHANVIETINQIIKAVIGKAGISPENIYSVTLAGNTCMQHLLLSLNPVRLGKAPFLPVVGQQVELTASELGLALNPRARVWVFPVIAGFVGGDTVSAILASNLHRRKGVALLIDIGTNGELVINAHGRMVACSAAAGPALEGGQVTFGMRAEKGAITKVQLHPELQLESIGQGPVKGICGSGLIDLVGELISAGLINSRGKMIGRESFDGPDYLKDRLIKTEKGRSFRVMPAEENDGREIYVTQGDISQIQLAKGALRAAMELLIQTVNVAGESVEEVLLAGAFGNYMDTRQALMTGLLPPWARGKVRMVGNAAGEGAKLALLSADKRREAAEISKKVEFLELAGKQDFQEAFIQGMLFHEALLKK